MTSRASCELDQIKREVLDEENKAEVIRFSTYHRKIRNRKSTANCYSEAQGSLAVMDTGALVACGGKSNQRN